MLRERVPNYRTAPRDIEGQRERTSTHAASVRYTVERNVGRAAMEPASLLNDVRHTKHRFITLCYRVQKSRMTLAQSLSKLNGARPWIKQDYGHHHDLRTPPLYAFITATNGVRRMVQQPGIAGGAMNHDEPATGLAYTQQYRDGSVVLAVAGGLDLATVSSFRARLKSAAEATDNLILDFSRLRYIDAAGIHVLLDVCQMLTLTGRSMALAAVRANVQRVLAAFETDGAFPVFATVEAAIVAWSLSVPRHA